VIRQIASDALMQRARARYPWFEQDAHGVWQAPSGARVAWFKDPDGNLLSVTQYPAGSGGVASQR
jgi:hypothetical protein